MANDEGRSLTLYEIESEMEELVEALDNVADPEQRIVMVNALELYVAARVEKVDGIRAYIRNQEAIAEAAGEEAKRQHERVRVAVRRVEAIKGMIKETMIVMGHKKLEGRTGTFTLAGNGGVEPLDVYNPDAVPDDCCNYSITLNHSQWKALAPILEPLKQHKRNPDQALMRAAIERDGGIPGAQLLDRGQHVRVR